MNQEKNEESSKTNWRKLYLIVIGFLVLQVIVYYFITAYFSK